MESTRKISGLLCTVFLVLIFVLKLNPASAQTDWKLSTDKEGIKIFTGTVSNSKVKAIKVECYLNATPAQLAAVVMDVKNSPEWVYHTKSCMLIKQVSSSELYYYSEISLPWPAQNRDFVAHLTVTKNPVSKALTIDGPAVPGYVPVKDGIVRVDHSSGKWIITPTSATQVKVEYTIHTDPGGDLPAWLVNMFATDGPLQIFRNLKLELQKPAYKNAELALAE